MNAYSYQAMNAGRPPPERKKEGELRREGQKQDFEFPTVLPADDVPSLKDERFGAVARQAGQETSTTPGLPAFRADLNKMLGMFKITEAAATEIKSVLSTVLDPASEHYLENLLAVRHRKNGGSTVRAEYVALDKDSQMSLPLEDRARQMGALYFLCRVLQRDPVLGEQLARFYTPAGPNPGINLAGLTEAVEEFWNQHGEKDLDVSRILLTETDSDEVNAAERAIFDGMVRPYCDCASAQPVAWYERFLRWIGYERPGPDGYFLSSYQRDFLSRLEEGKSEFEILLQGVDQKLREVLEVYRISDSNQLLDALETYVKDAKSLSMTELLLILKAVPTGINWGRDNGLANLKKQFKSENDLKTNKETFVTCDLNIIVLAFGKTTRAEGMDYAGEVGMLAKAIATESHTVKTLMGYGVPQGPLMLSMIDNEYGAMMTRFIKKES